MCGDEDFSAVLICRRLMEGVQEFRVLAGFISWKRGYSTSFYNGKF
jgi:hypothetical protein